MLMAIVICMIIADALFVIGSLGSGLDKVSRCLFIIGAVYVSILLQQIAVRIIP